MPRYLSACFMTALPLSASAQTTTSNEVVISASRLTNTVSTPYSVSVIPEAQLAGRSDVADVLNGQAEIRVQTPGGRSGAASVFLRGADPNFTVVMLDDIPLNNSTDSRGGSVNVSAINASMLQRIELVAGPLSGLYGSGALAGAINLVVPGGTQDHQLQTQAGIGSHGYWSAAARWQGPVAATLGGSAAVIADNDGEQTPNAGFKSRTFIGKIAPMNTEEGGRLIVRLHDTDVKTYPDSSGGPRLATRSTLESRKSKEQLLGVSAPFYQTSELRLDVAASLLNRRDDTVTPGVARSAIDPVGIPAGNDVSRYRRVIGQVAGKTSLGNWMLGGGVEAVRETGSSNGMLDFGFFRTSNNFDLHRSTTSGFIEANRHAQRWTFNTGMRLDDVQGVASRATARIGVLYALADSGFSLRASAGSGFKAPSFYALGNPFVGNKQLKPEESMGGEVGLNWSGGTGDSARLTLFRTRYRELIDFVPGPPPRLENRNLVISRGVAATITHSFSTRLSTTLQTQYAQTRDAATDEPLLNRPEWRINASLNWQATDAFDLVARYGHVGERDDYATPVGVQTLDAYDVASVELRWQVLKATTARLVIDNAFNSQYEDALGFASPGARARVTVDHRF